jgi:hypothetical protein
MGIGLANAVAMVSTTIKQTAKTENFFILSPPMETLGNSVFKFSLL